LTGSLFVSGRAVYLTGKIESGDPLYFHGRQKLRRVDIVVFDAVSGSDKLGALQARDRTDHLDLNIERKACRETVRVVLHGIEPFRLEEDVVPLPVGEPEDLIFDRGAISHARPLDYAGKER